MKLDFKRAGLLLMALMLWIPTLGSLVPAASAEKVQTDPYVFQYMPSSLPADYGYNVPYFYMTPFTIQHTITRADGTSYYSGSSVLQVFNLINTAKLEDSGQGAYASIAAYCADASADIRFDTTYRRIDLEDAIFPEQDAAGRIRAVVLNSFPRKGIKAIQVRANAWLRCEGKPELVDLQSGEAILATQAAIWTLTGGERYTIDNLYHGRVELNADARRDWLERIIYPNVADQQQTDHTEQNVKSLYEYLCNLEPETPRFDAVSEAVFENPAYDSARQTDGTYTVSVTVTLNLPVGSQDTLTLRAACGEQVRSQPVTAAGAYDFHFQSLSEASAVDLEISGEQYGGDVYLFDAEGGRDVSQPLVGYDSSKLPVYARITVSPEGIRYVRSGEVGTAQIAPGIQMDVSAIGCRSGSFAVDESHLWIIRGGIPADIGNARRYEIAGNVDNRMTYALGSPVVCLYTKAGDSLPLRLGDHYTLVETPSNGNAIDSFTISLTPAGMAYVSANLGRGENTPEIHVSFQSAINENAAMGERIANAASLDYTNSAGVAYHAGYGASEVFTGGLHIRVTDPGDTPLAGAVFRLARPATEAEQADPLVEKVTVNTGTEQQTVAFVSFYVNEALKGGRVWEVSTGKDGIAALYGLAYGTYYLVETKAPAGCSLPQHPVAVTVSSVSHLTGDGGQRDGNIPDNTVRITSDRLILPETGGTGTAAFHVIGAAIIGSACLLLLSNRNRRP